MVYIFIVFFLCSKFLPLNSYISPEEQLKAIEQGKAKSIKLAQLIKEQQQNPLIAKDQELYLLKHQHKQLSHEVEQLRNQTIKKEHNQQFSLLNFSADLRPTYWHGSNLELLNSANKSDQYSFFEYLLDSSFMLNNKFNTGDFNPLNIQATIRLKGIMGNVGQYTQTTETPIKIGVAMTESEHSHSINRLLLWARELWIKYCFSEFDPNQFFQIGFFPFKLGNGITLGNAHSMGTTIPGQYNYQAIDQFRPGILLSGSFLHEWLTLQLYTGFITTKSDTFSATASFTNAQNLDLYNKPERGPWKKDFVVAFQALFEPYRQENRDSTVTVNPYLLFNNNNDAAIEFASDSELRIYTPGIAVNYEKNGLSFSFEAAKNFGHQQVKAWDRNVFINSSATFQNHLFYVPSGTAGVTFTDNDFATNGVADPDDFELSTLLLNPTTTAQNYANGEKFAILNTDDTTYTFFKNSYSRFRKNYTNKLDGWMLYGDIKYTGQNFSVGAAAACISGDNNPNDSEEKIMLTRLTSGITYQDVSKTYKGFVGLEQLFSNKTITSYFILESRKMNRPLCASHKLTQPMLTNLVFFGLHGGYHTIFKDKKLEAQCNLLSFFQYKKTLKDYNYHLTDALSINHTSSYQTDAAQLLDYHLGIEINGSIHCEVAPDVSLFGTCALFIPGNYYNTAQGKYIPIATQIKLQGSDFSGIEDATSRYNITLGKESAVLLCAGISAQFDLHNFKTRTSKKNYNSLARITL